MHKAFSRIASAVAVSVGLSVAGAMASTVTIAQFQEAPGGPSANQFSYVNAVLDPPGAVTGLASVLDNIGVSIPVIFTYNSIPGLPADLQGPQQAMLTLTTATNQPVITLGGAIAEQNFNVLAADTLTITRDTPASGGGGLRTDLLTVNFTGSLVAVPGGGVAVLGAETAGGNTINYSSDFLPSFTGTADFGVTFTSWTSGDGGAVEVLPDSSGFADATAAAVGSFDATVPEPCSIALAGVAGAGLLMRRRRAAK